VARAVPNPRRGPPRSISPSPPRRSSVFSLTDASAPNDQELAPGTYSVSELVPAGWSRTGLVITDPNGNSFSAGDTATISLEAGETVTITSTDTKLAHIVCRKLTNPNDDP